MALTLVEKKKQQKILILVLVAVLLIMATVLWLGFLKKEPVVVTEGPQGVVVPVLSQIEVNFNVLSLPLLQELNSPAEPVLEPSNKGRSNPFLPF